MISRLQAIWDSGHCGSAMPEQNILPTSLQSKKQAAHDGLCVPRFLRAIPGDDAAAAALALVGAPAAAAHRRALVAFLAARAPDLAPAGGSGGEELHARLRRTQLGLDALAHVPPPWDERVGHLIGAAGLFRPLGRRC